MLTSREKVTSAFAPDPDEVRAWLEAMITALQGVELVTAVLGLIGRMREINTELATQLNAQLLVGHDGGSSMARRWNAGRGRLLP